MEREQMYSGEILCVTINILKKDKFKERPFRKLGKFEMLSLSNGLLGYQMHNL